MVKDLIDHSTSIKGYTITVGWLLNSLRNNDKEFAKLHGSRAVKDVTYVDVSEGKGFASEIIQCTIHFENSDDPKDVYTTVLKIPGVEAMKKGMAENGEGPAWSEWEEKQRSTVLEIHQAECAFYSELAPILDGPVPKVYSWLDWKYGVQDGCIHMEDLTSRGKTLTFFDGIPLTQVKNIIRALAHMHKNILEADEQFWKGKYLGNQDRLVKFMDFLIPLNEPFLEKCTQKDKIKPLMDKYQKILESHAYGTYVNCQSYKDLNLAPVIVHGDSHGGNIMWATDSHGDVQPSLAALLDWQTVHEGSPMTDLARFLVYATDGVVRRQAETFAIDFYLECLTAEFGGDTTKVPYTKKQLQKAYNLAFIFQASGVMGCALFLQSLLEGKETNKGIIEASWDSACLRCLHALEDIDRLLQENLKDMAEKFN